MKFRIHTQQTQKQIFTPSMQQSIEILQLPLAELTQTIDQELQNNPLLEIDEEKQKSKDKQLEDIINMKIKNPQTSERDEDNASSYFEDEEEPYEKPLTKTIGLEDVLFEQLRMEINDPLERKIGELIIGNLDENGFLSVSLEEIVQLAGTSDVSGVEAVLVKVQSFEPIGIAARNLKECLLNQIKLRDFNGQSELIKKLIEDHLDALGKKKFLDIARALKIDEEKVRSLAQMVATLEPKPARKYRPIESNIYVIPDIFIYKDVQETYSLVVNQDSIPPLRINTTYQRMLKKGNCTLEELEFIKEKIKSALLFIKSIEQRNHTIKQIAQYILDNQKDFFDKGTAHLKPMVFKDVALVIDRNESTISRAIQNKYMDTPQGVFPLRYFFSQALEHESNGTSVSNRSVKEELKNLVDDEDKHKPLSDQEIQKLFRTRGMNVARRTVSKYRQQLNILPAYLRKQ